MAEQCVWCGEMLAGNLLLLKHILEKHAPSTKSATVSSVDGAGPSRTVIPLRARTAPTSRKSPPRALPLQTAAAAPTLPKTSKNHLCCGVCKKQYKHKRSLVRHHYESHGEKKHGCQQCSKLFKSKRTLKQHILLKHKKSVVRKKGHRCLKCVRVFESLKELYVHKRDAHPPRYDRYVCPSCFKRFRTPSMWQWHLRVCKDQKNKQMRFHELKKKRLYKSRGGQTQSNDSVLEQTETEWETETAIGGDARVHTLYVSDSYDVQLTLLKHKEKMLDILLGDIKDLRRMKWYLAAHIHCHSTEDGKEKNDPITKYLKCSPVISLGQYDLESKLEKAILACVNSYDTSQVEGSHLLFEKVYLVELRVAKYSPFRGSSFLPLPAWLKIPAKGLINIQNYNDNKCFLWSCLAGVALPRVHPERLSHYKNREKELCMKNIKYPVKLNDISKFETQNKGISVSVFGLEEESAIVPLRVTPKLRNRHINLLLLQEGDEYHYVLIKNISRFLSHLTTRRKRLYWCENCLTPRDKKEKHLEHRERCIEHDAQAIKMPAPKDSTMKFTEHYARMRHDYVIYCDIEAVLEPYDTALHDPSHSRTTKINKHVACGYSYVIIGADGSMVKAPVVERGPDVIRKLLLSLRKEQGEINKLRGEVYPIDMTEESIKRFAEATHCYMCGDRVPREGVVKVRDHDWSKEKDNFRGAACNAPCNLNLKRREYIPVIMHNLSGYDAHHIISEIGQLTDGSDLTAIPRTKEKYVSFTWGKLRFLDSYGFLSSSLDTLVKDLSADDMSCINFMFPDEEKRKLVAQKGAYPYEYFDSLQRFEEDSLPPPAAFSNGLTNTDISEEKYKHAQRVWSQFNMSTLGDNHDLYILTDTLLLADVMESYRRSSKEQFDLDVVHYYTTPGFAWSAALSFTKQKLELITDIDLHLMWEKGVRGGVSSINGRYAEANNPYIPDTYQPEKSKSYIMYYDCNALYSTAMARKLPVSGFRFLSEDEIKELDVMALSEHDDIGYLIEADIMYPDCLHDDHNDYCLAPEHVLPEYENLSELQKDMIKKYDLPERATTKKLIPNLHHKKSYGVNGSTLKLYLQLGMKLSTIHRVMEFYQKAWLAPFIKHNTEMRKQATSDFQKAFFKLLNNATYGKTIESVRKRRNVSFTKQQDKFRKLVKSPLYHSFEIFDFGLVCVERRKGTVVLNRPVYTGQVVLDISKEIMYDFHYNVIKEKYGDRVQVLGTDTDSLIYKIETQDIYIDMGEMLDYFDTSDYDKEHALYSIVNKKSFGKFKDEMNGVPIKAFVGLKAKMYCFERKDDVQKCVAKGIPRIALQQQLSFKDYKKCHEDISIKSVSFSKISTDQKHHLFQTYSTKRGLSCYDDKRFILKNNKDTLGYGHYRLRNKVLNSKDEIGPKIDFNDDASLNLAELIDLMDEM